MNSTNVMLGIVLKSTPTGESNLRLHILTANGIITATATGAQKPAAKLKSAVQIFTVAEFSITSTRITAAHVILSPMPITHEINRYYLACSMAEVLMQIKNHDAQVFVLAARTFEELSATKTSAYKIFIDFFSNLLSLLGFGTKFETPENLGLTAAKKLVTQINAAYVEHLDISIPCTTRFIQ